MYSMRDEKSIRSGGRPEHHLHFIHITLKCGTPRIFSLTPSKNSVPEIIFFSQTKLGENSSLQIEEEGGKEGHP